MIEQSLVRTLSSVLPLGALLALAPYTAGAQKGGLVQEAREAAGGAHVLRAPSSIELRGTLHRGNFPDVAGAFVTRLQLPDKFVIVDRLSTGRTYVGAMDGEDYWAALGDQRLPSLPEGRSQLRRRLSRAAASYLLSFGKECVVVEDLVRRTARVGGCGEFVLEFSRPDSMLGSISFAGAVVRGGPVEIGELARGGAKPALEKDVTSTAFSTVFSDFRSIDGWRVPFVAITTPAGLPNRLVIEQARLNASFTKSDFTPGQSLMEARRWVESRAP